MIINKLKKRYVNTDIDTTPTTPTMSFTYDLTNVYESLEQFAKDKDFGMGDDSKNNPLNLKKNEFINKNGDRYTIVKYDHDTLSNDMRDKTGLFRSLIFKNGRLVTFSPPKSLSFDLFNSNLMDLKEEVNSKIDFVAEEFVEGTMINLFYQPSSSEGEDGEWELSTRSTVGAKISFYQREEGGRKTFRTMFLDAMLECGLEFDSLNTDYCYSFVLQHPENRIVAPISKSQLYLVAVYKIHQGDVSKAEGGTGIQIEQIHEVPEFISTTGVKQPEMLTESLVDDLKYKYASMNTPYHVMGFVLKENTTGMRCKFRNPNYEEVKLLRGNQPKLLFQYISLRKQGSVATYLRYFPEHKAQFNQMRDRIHSFTNMLHANYMSCFVFKQKQLKEFSKQFRPHMYKLHACYLEALRETGGRVDRQFVIHYVNTLHPAQLMFALNFSFREQNVDFVKQERGEPVEKQEETESTFDMVEKYECMKKLVLRKQQNS